MCDLLATILSFIHMIRIQDGIGLIVAEDDGGDGGPSLSGLLLQLLSPSWIVDDRDYSRSRIHCELTIVYEALNLQSHVLGVTEVLLQFIFRSLKLLDLCKPSCQFSFGVRLDPLLLLDLFLGSASFGRHLHEMT